MTTCVATSLLLLAGLDASGGARIVDRQLCGPIAVEAILRHYGKRSELAEIIDAVYRDTDETISSMAALSQVLNEHGVSTLAVHLGNGAAPCWNAPAIIHLRSPTCYPDGHFVVVWPIDTAVGGSDVNCVAVSLTAPRIEHVAWTDLDELRSPVVLLTSPVSIDAAACGYSRGGARRWGMGILLGAISSILVYVILPRRLQ